METKSGGRDILFFVITSSDSRRRVLRYQPCSGMPSTGLPATLATEMGAMQERITSTKRGSITSVRAVTYLRMT